MFFISSICQGAYGPFRFCMKRFLFAIYPTIVLSFCARGETQSSPVVVPARPNLVLYLSDDHGLDFVGCYGNQVVRTPNIDKLAREGVKFNRVFAASPTCSPSRAAMFTGLWPQRNGTMGNHTDCRPGIQSLPAYLQALGYRVVAANKTDVRPAVNFTWELLPATLPTNGHFRRYRDEGLDTARVDAFLAAHVRDHPGQPLCLLLGDNGPHVVWETNRIYDPAALPMTPLLVDPLRFRIAGAVHCPLARRPATGDRMQCPDLADRYYADVCGSGRWQGPGET
jgi:Sulfatase